MAVENQETTLDDALNEGAEDLGFPNEETGDTDFEVVVDEQAEDGAEEGAAAEEGTAEEGAAAPEAAAEGEQAAEGAEAAEGEADFVELETAPPAFRKAVKARWEREKRLRAQIIGERDQIRDAAVQVANIAKQREQELTTVKTQMLELQRQHAEVLEVTFDKEIALKSREMRAARDNNEYDTEQKLQGELETLRFQQNQIKEARRNIPATPAASATPTTAAPAASEPAGAQPAPAKKPLTPAAAKWVANNKVWLESPKFAGHREFVVGVDRQLQREGYLPTTDEFFKELDRRVDEAFPTLRKKPATPPRPPVAAVGGGAQSAPGKRTVTLNKADLENMRKFGLDPTNKAHLREYASNKAA